MKRLFILSVVLAVVLALMLVGCITGKEQVLIPLTDKIYLEEYDTNLRSYHMKIAEDVALQMFGIQIFSLNGVQDVKIMAYQISVLKSPLFKWEDIQPEILKILKQ